MNWFGRKAPSPVEEIPETKTSNGVFGVANWNSLNANTNSASLAACRGWGQRAIAEAELVAEQFQNGAWVDQPLPMVILRDAQKSGLDLSQKIQATYTDSYVGNSIWIKLKNGRNKLVGFQFVPWSNVSVQKSADQSKIVSYSINGTTYAPSDVVHFRFGADPNDFLLGFDKLSSLKNLIEADVAAQVYQAAIINSPTPGHILSTTKSRLNQETIDKLVVQYREMTSGRNAGGLIVLSDADFDLKAAKFSPAELDVTKISDYVEEKICATIGIPREILGLGNSNATYNNLQSAQRQAATNHVIPFLAVVAKSLTEQCPELFFDNNRLRFKTEDLAAMQVDANAESDRVGKLYERGVISRGDAKSLLGYTPDNSEFNVYAAKNTTANVINNEDTNA